MKFIECKLHVVIRQVLVLQLKFKCLEHKRQNIQITGKRHKNWYGCNSEHTAYTKCSAGWRNYPVWIVYISFPLLKNVILHVPNGFPYLLRQHWCALPKCRCGFKCSVTSFCVSFWVMASSSSSSSFYISGSWLICCYDNVCSVFCSWYITTCSSVLTELSNVEEILRVFLRIPRHWVLCLCGFWSSATPQPKLPSLKSLAIHVGVKKYRTSRWRAYSCWIMVLAVETADIPTSS